MLIYKPVNLLIHKLYCHIQLKFKGIIERNVITYPYYLLNVTCKITLLNIRVHIHNIHEQRQQEISDYI